MMRNDRRDSPFFFLSDFYACYFLLRALPYQREKHNINTTIVFGASPIKVKRTGQAGGFTKA